MDSQLLMSFVPSPARLNPKRIWKQIICETMQGKTSLCHVTYPQFINPLDFNSGVVEMIRIDVNGMSMDIKPAGGIFDLYMGTKASAFGGFATEAVSLIKS